MVQKADLAVWYPSGSSKISVAMAVLCPLSFQKTEMNLSPGLKPDCPLVKCEPITKSPCRPLSFPLPLYTEVSGTNVLINAEKKNPTIFFQSTHCTQGSSLFVTLWTWHCGPPPVALCMPSRDTTRTLSPASNSLLEVAPFSS